MDTDPLARVIAALGADPAHRLDQRLCEACHDVIGASGAAVTVMGEGGPPGLLCSSDATASALEELQGTLGAVGDQRAEVHQGAGMLAVRFDTSVGDALVRLRAHAYGDGRPLADVARDVVAGRLLLE